MHKRGYKRHRRSVTRCYLRHTKKHVRKREDDSPAFASNSPLDGNKRRRDDDDPGEQQNRHEQREPEPLRDLWDLLEEIRSLDFLLRRTPRDVVREQVCEDRLGERDRETAKEEEAIVELSASRTS